MAGIQLFDELFPTSARAFELGGLTNTEWLEGLEEGEAELRWKIALWSDDLLKQVTSYRESENLFVRYKFVSKLRLLREMFAMAGRKAIQESRRQEEKAEWKGFLDRRLTDDELSALDEWRPKPSEAWQAVDQLLQGGYRMTLSYNKGTKLTSCTLIDDDPSRKTGGYALSNADTDGSLALKMAVYKHFSLLEGNWEPLLLQPTRSRRG